MKDNHEGAVRRVAEFIGFGNDDERIAVACQESSLASMKAHPDKYDDLMMRERSEVVCDLPLGSDTNKVRSGEVGARPTGALAAVHCRTGRDLARHRHRRTRHPEL